MESTTTSTVSKPMLWTGRVLSALPVLLLLFGAVMKIIRHPSVLEGFAKQGLPAHLIVPVGIIELVSVIVYLIPATSVLGAVLITGVMGGAILTNLRVDDPTYVAPIIVGILAWAGLYLRDPRVRSLLPFRR